MPINTHTEIILSELFPPQEENTGLLIAYLLWGVEGVTSRDLELKSLSLYNKEKKEEAVFNNPLFFREEFSHMEDFIKAFSPSVETFKISCLLDQIEVQIEGAKNSKTLTFYYDKFEDPCLQILASEIENFSYHFTTCDPEDITLFSRAFVLPENQVILFFNELQIKGVFKEFLENTKPYLKEGKWGESTPASQTLVNYLMELAGTKEVGVTEEQKSHIHPEGTQVIFQHIIDQIPIDDESDELLKRYKAISKNE